MDGLKRNLLGLRKSVSDGGKRRPLRTYRPASGLEKFEERTLLSVALVSVNSGGVAGNGGSQLVAPYSSSGMTSNSSLGSLSVDSKSLVFQSDATDLVPGVSDSNSQSDIFVRNLQTGETQLVDATPGGQAGNGRSSQPVISPDGRYAVFLSTATNLTSVRPNRLGAFAYGSMGNLYLRDLQTHTTTLLDVATDGKASDGYATGEYAFSPDGTKLAFTDLSTNLTSTPPSGASAAPGPSGGGVYSNVYLRNLAAGTTEAITVTPDGTLSQGNLDYGGTSSQLVFSPDGTQLAFVSSATDLTDQPPAVTSDPGRSASDGPSSTNLYVHDLSSGVTDLVTVTPDGTLADGNSSQPVFSPDGHLLAFLSTATNLTSESAPAVTADSPDIPGFNINLFVRDLSAGTTQAVSVTSDDALSSGYVSQMAFSPDGKSLAFISSGTDLTDTSARPSNATISPMVPGFPSFGTSNVYWRDLSSGATTAVSVTPNGSLSNGNASSLSFSPDGHSLAYLSTATDLTVDASTKTLAPSDGSTPSLYPSVNNLFLTDLATKATNPVSVTPDGTLTQGYVSSYGFSPDGKFVAFTDPGTDLTENPPAPQPDQDPNGFPWMPGAPWINSLFVRDLHADTTTLIGAAADGTIANDPVNYGVSSYFFSPDSMTLYFGTGAGLVVGDTNNASDIYSATAPFATPGAIHFASWQYHPDETATEVTIKVVRNAPLDDDVTVDYHVNDGTARAGIDFQATSGSLHFAPGQASATFTIPLTTPPNSKDLKTATITLSANGVPLGSPNATLMLGSTMVPGLNAPVTVDGSWPTMVSTFLNKSSTSSSTASNGSETAATTTPTSATLVKTLATTQTTLNSRPLDYTSAAAASNGSETAATTTPTSATLVKTLATTQTTLNSRPLDYTSAAATIQTAIDAANATATNTVGPKVSSVALRTARRAINGLVIHFNEPLAIASAGNPANYHVHLLQQGHRTRRGVHQMSVGQAVGVASARYDASAQTVTLTFRSSLKSGQLFQIRVRGGRGGITDPAGNLLNSPTKGAQGNDYVLNLS